jgi:hypothetical protein
VPFKTLHTNPTSKCKVFLCANKQAPTLTLLLSSLERNGYSYEVLGYNQPWTNLFDKIKYYEQATISHTGPEEVLIYIDAFDVISIKDSTTLYDRWLKRPRAMQIVYSSENNCFGNCSKKRLLEWYDVHKELLPPPYNLGSEELKKHITIHQHSDNPITSELNLFANSGCILGTHTDLQWLFQELMKLPEKYDDQIQAIDFLSDHLDKYDIDVERNFFQTFVTMDTQQLPKSSDPTAACFLHFPGNRSDEQKAALAKLFSEQYYSRANKQLRGGNPLSSSEIKYPPSSINEYVLHVVYINLDDRTDRRVQIENELKVFSPGKVTRIPGVKDTNKARGCTTGHLNALLYARDHNFPNVLVLEDDAMWSNIDASYPLFEKLVTKSYDVVMLGATELDYDTNTFKIKKALTASSYLVNSSYYTTIIERLQGLLNTPNFDSLPYCEQIVDCKPYNDLQSTGQWFIVIPSLMIQRKSYSNIEGRLVNYEKMFK